MTDLSEADDASPEPDVTSDENTSASGAGLLKRHAIANGLATLVSIAAVAWLGTQTAGGTGLVVGVTFILFNLGSLLSGRPRPTKRHALRHAVAWCLLSAATTLISCANPALVSLQPSQSAITPVPQVEQYRPPADQNVPLAEPKPSFAVHENFDQSVNSADSSIIAPLRPVRAFLPAGSIPPPGVGAYGVVAFSALPTDASRERLKKVCASYLATLPSQAAIPASIPLRDQMITFWPVQGNPAPSPDCDWLLDNYDLFGGTSAIQDAESQGQDLSGRGPFLIGWSPSTARGVKDAVVLVVDLSPFESQASFDGQFAFWRREIVENPSVWRGGFSLEGLRLAVRDWADRNGSNIVQAIRIWGR